VPQEQQQQDLSAEGHRSDPVVKDVLSSSNDHAKAAPLRRGRFALLIYLRRDDTFDNDGMS
jgi:hypothetical protein